MNSVKGLATVMLVSWAFGALAVAAEVKQPEEQLKIEVVKEPANVQGFERVSRADLAYVVSLQINGPNMMQAGNYSWGPRDILSTEAAKSFSERQKSLVERGPKDTDPEESAFRETGSVSVRWYRELWGSQHALVYKLAAVSEEDARLTARAVLQWHTTKAKEYSKSRREVLMKQIDECKKQIASAEEAIPRMEREVADATSKLAEMKTLRNYGTQEDTERRSAEYDHLLIAAEVELAGVQAKIEAIRKQREQLATAGKDRERLLTALDDALVTENIEMTGALARKTAALAGRKDAEEFRSLSLKLKQLESDLGNAKRRFSDTLELENLAKRLAETPEEPKISGSAIIKPVMIPGVAGTGSTAP